MNKDEVDDSSNLLSWSMDKGTLMRMDKLMCSINSAMIEGFIFPQKRFIDVLADEVIPLVDKVGEKEIEDLTESTNKDMNNFVKEIIKLKIKPFRMEEGKQVDIEPDEFFDSMVELKYPQILNIINGLRPKLKKYNKVLRKRMGKQGLLMRKKKDTWSKDEE